MDKNTLANYGWIVCVVLVLSMMIALATPFATAVKNSVVGTTNGLSNNLNDALAGSWGDSAGDDAENDGGEQLPAGGEVSETGEILDSWEVIINNVNNGTYSTKYAVGNYKSLDLGSEGIVNMQIAALDADDMTGGGKAHITWITKELLATKHNMNSSNTNAGGWETSKMRAYLQADVWALIDPAVQNAIIAVDKTYFDSTAGTKTCSDKVWIPSCREIGLIREGSGVVYSELFPDKNSRVKYLNGTASYWWVRSTYPGDNGFYGIGTNGTGYNVNASGANGVALSFCF